MNQTDKIVSVIIPIYNRETTLEESIQSVLNQSFQHFEIILIDDGSTDNTLNICNKLSSSDSRIKLFKSEHVGVSAARNIGLDSAQGEFVLFLDSDDIIHPNLLDAFVCGMEESGAAMAGTVCLPCIDENWKTVSEKFINDDSKYETTYHNHEQTLKAFFETSSPIGMIGGVMMRRSLIGDTKFSTDLFIGEDFYFIYQNLIKNADAIFIKQKWYLDRIHSQNASWQYDFDGFWTRFHRRVLVWKSEETFSRTKYADIQKNDAFGCFYRCISKNKVYSIDAKKMRKVLRRYKKEILPTFSLPRKLMYIIAAYFPITFLLITKIRGIRSSKNKK